MAVNYRKVEKTVKKAIADLGEKRIVTLLQPSSTPYDTTKSYEGPADNFIDYGVEAVVLPPPSGSKSARDIGIDQTRGDQIAYITGSALSVSPAVGWLCEVDAVKYKISRVTQTRPGKTTVLWTLVLER